MEILPWEPCLNTVLNQQTIHDLFVLNPAHSKAHKSGDIHIHDLDFLTLTTTCCQIDIIKLFEDGFSTGHGLREPMIYCLMQH